MLLHPIDRFEWEKCVRLVKMPTTTKLVALALATYGNRQGSNIHPGNKRLATELGVSPRTIERAVDWLRSHGLLEQTFKGRSAGRKGLANAYRLAVAEDLPDRVDFAVSPDTTDGSSGPATPDTGDGSSAESPDTDDGTSVPITRHEAPEHPTSATGTPDIFDGTPDTGDDPSWKYQQNNSPSKESSGGASTPQDDDEYNRELAEIKSLPQAVIGPLLDEAQDAVGGGGWNAVVHYAATRLRERASA